MTAVPWTGAVAMQQRAPPTVARTPRERGVVPPVPQARCHDDRAFYSDLLCCTV